MKRYFLLFAVLVCVALAACKKGNDPATQASVDDAKIQRYLTVNGIFDAKKDTSGLYYEVVAYGPGQTNPANFPIAAKDSMVKVSYNGKYLNGQTFSNQSITTFNLNTVIKGFSYGLRFINVGGRIRLFVPSKLAYGPAGTGDGGIPPNACVVFTVDLLGFY